jgi:hypothetical protein
MTSKTETPPPAKTAPQPGPNLIDRYRPIGIASVLAAAMMVKAASQTGAT